MMDRVFLFEESADFISCVNVLRSYMGDMTLKPAAALSKREWIENMLLDGLSKEEILEEAKCSGQYFSRVKRGLGRG